MSLFRGAVEDVPIEAWFNEYIWPMESNLEPEDVYWGALLGLAEMIEGGVTSIADHYFATHEVARAVEQAGTRAALAWTIFDRANAKQQRQRMADFVARWNGAAGGRISAWLGPHSPYVCGRDLLAQVARQAQEFGIGIHIHLAETAQQVEQSLAQYGRTPVAIVYDSGLFAVPTIAAHVAHLREGDMELLREHGVGVACCPKTAMKLGSGVAPVAAMRQAGVTVGVGTDGAASNNTYDILEATRLLALLQKHEMRDPQSMPLAEALSLATRDGARVLGLNGVIGELGIGMQADIALLQIEAVHVHPHHNLVAHLLYSAKASDVDTVLVAGRVLMRERRLLTIDKAQVMREAASRRERLTQRLPERRIQTYPSNEYFDLAPSE
jgi:5-methylthioadenosine/S-adenosylhomocysteine deaminase